MKVLKKILMIFISGLKEFGSLLKPRRFKKNVRIILGKLRRRVSPLNRQLLLYLTLPHFNVRLMRDSVSPREIRLPLLKLYMNGIRF